LAANAICHDPRQSLVPVERRCHFDMYARMFRLQPLDDRGQVALQMKA
jgi:hypothetical protein